MKSKLEPFKNEIIKMYTQEGLTCKQIGQKFNLRPNPVRTFLAKHGVKIRNPHRRPGTTSWSKGMTFTEKSIEYNRFIIESGEYKKLAESNIRKHMRAYLIRKYGHKCQICGLSKWRGEKLPLVCDHIDGVSANCELENFRVICNNCDSILPTYKGKNRGKGRKTLFGQMAELV